MKNQIWTYPVTNTEDFSQVAYSFGGCVDAFCWRKKRDGRETSRCPYYEKDLISNEEHCTKGVEDVPKK